MTTSTTTGAARKRKKRGPYRAYLSREVMRMAFLAGQGLSGGQIADHIGDTTGGRVRRQLHNYGISLPRVGDDDIILLRWARRDTEALTAVADARDRDPSDIAVILLRILLAEPVLLGNLLDEAEMIEAARR